MAEIKFDTGLVEYDLNGKCKICFNPTDGAFVERLFNCFSDMDKRHEAYASEIEKCGDKIKIFDIARNRDREIREMINGVLGANVCDPLFGEMNICALADGLPVWCNLMLAIMDECDSAFSREQMRTNPRIKKYTAKYHK